MLTRRHRPIGVTAALALAFALALTGPLTVLAAEPSPSPVVFPQPHYLVFMESHSTMDGPVVDKMYWLYPYLPEDGGHFVVPDGTGGVWHYSGRVVGGPYASDDEACPQMISLGIPSLTTWATAAGESELVVDCARFRATPSPSPSPSTAPTSTADADPDAEPDAESLELAVMIIGLALFGGGTAGVVIGRRGPEAVKTDPVREKPEPPADPCAEQAAAVEQASLQGRYLNNLIMSSNQYDAVLEKQIDVLANLTLPGSVLMDLGFAAGGLSGGVSRKLIATETVWKALGEAVIKDVVKDLAKQGLGSDAIDAVNTASEGGLSAAKQVLLTAVRESIVNRRFFGELSPSSPVKVFRDMGSYVKFKAELEGFADTVAGPIADGLGAVLDLYSGALDGLALKDRLDNLRAVRDRIADERATLEIRLEDALEAHRFAADRLTHCRRINAPDWRP